MKLGLGIVTAAIPMAFFPFSLLPVPALPDLVLPAELGGAAVLVVVERVLPPLVVDRVPPPLRLFDGCSDISIFLS